MVEWLRHPNRLDMSAIATLARLFPLLAQRLKEALHKPNGLCNKKSSLRVVKADFNLASFVNLTCQYPLSKSNVKKTLLLIEAR